MDIQKLYEENKLKIETKRRKHFLKEFISENSVKILISHYIKHGCFYNIGKQSYEGYITRQDILALKNKLQRKIKQKVIIGGGFNAWQFELEDK